MDDDRLEARLSHAEQHLGLLDERARAYLAGEQDNVVQEFDPQTSRVLFKFVGAAPPVELSLIFGDVVHALRSTLDNAVSEASRLSGKPFKEHASNFPVVRNQPGKSFTIATKCLTLQQRAVVDAAQPYHRGPNATNHPLAMLDLASNVDKHRLLATSVVCPDAGKVLTADGRRIPIGVALQTDVELIAHLGPAPVGFIDCDGPRVGDTVMHFATKPGEDAYLVAVSVTNPRGQPQVEMDPQVTPQVGWRQKGGQLDVPLLWELVVQVRQLVAAL